MKPKLGPVPLNKNMLYNCAISSDLGFLSNIFIFHLIICADNRDAIKKCCHSISVNAEIPCPATRPYFLSCVCLKK